MSKTKQANYSETVLQEQIHRNNNAIKKAIDEIKQNYQHSSLKDKRSLIFRKLQEKISLEEISINLSPYKVRDNNRGGYGKYLIYDDQSSDLPFSIWVFAFGERQKTPIHDHKIDCLTALLSDKSIIEKTYKIKSKQEKIVYRSKSNITEERRSKGVIKEDHLDNSFVHRLKNPYTKTAVTMHMYYMPAGGVSVEEWSSTVDIIYQKEPTHYDQIITSLKMLVNSGNACAKRLLKDIKEARAGGYLSLISKEKELGLKSFVTQFEKANGVHARM